MFSLQGQSRDEGSHPCHQGQSCSCQTRTLLKWSAVSLSYKVDDCRIVVHLLADFTIMSRPDRAQPTYSSAGITYLTRNKTARAWSRQLTSILCQIMNVCVQLYLHSPHMHSRCVWLRTIPQPFTPKHSFQDKKYPNTNSANVRSHIIYVKSSELPKGRGI